MSKRRAIRQSKGIRQRADRGEKFRAYELEDLPTLSTGQCDDLKVDTGRTKIWLSRCGMANGEPYNDKVTETKPESPRTSFVG